MLEREREREEESVCMSTVCACDECGYEACTKERQRVRVCLCVYCACVCSYRAGWVCMSKSMYEREKEIKRERVRERKRETDPSVTGGPHFIMSSSSMTSFLASTVQSKCLLIFLSPSTSVLQNERVTKESLSAFNGLQWHSIHQPK